MHRHRGGRPFWHDDIVRARNNNENADVAYQPEYDIASARYVAWAFHEGGNLRVKWEHKGDLIAPRNMMLRNFVL